MVSTVAEAEADMEFARLRDLEDKLVAMPAFTAVGMRAKAMIVDRVCWGSESETADPDADLNVPT